MFPSSFGETLSRLWPNGDCKISGLRAGIIATAPRVFQQFGITSPLLIAHVMAQISHECGAGRGVVESLNYTASRMMQVWPSRFPTLASATPFAGNSRALANKVYNGRRGNAVGSDDGFVYRGRGASQTTGREGYQRLANATGLDVVKNPDLVNDPRLFPALRRRRFHQLRLSEIRAERRRCRRHPAALRRARRAQGLAREMEGCTC
jgi:putative chitinase